MSFWDRIKPSTPPTQAVGVLRSPDGLQLTVSWPEGKTGSVSAQKLRQACPCAGCVDEWTRQRTLDVSGVPADLRILEMQSVGNYALAFVFSDRHTTGIYTWQLMQELCA